MVDPVHSVNSTIHVKIVRARKQFKGIRTSILVSIISMFFILPLVISITNSFMEEGEIHDNYQAIERQNEVGDAVSQENQYARIKLIPETVTLSQYYQVLVKQSDYVFFFWNSIKITLPIILGQLVVASMAAFAFAKLKFAWKGKLFFIYIIIMLMPYQVTLVPNYIIADKLNLIGNILSIIFPGVFSTFGVFLLRQFMIFIPDEYVEAAKVDGSGYFHIFLQIILPMTKAGLASLTILLLIDNWNMVEQPIVFLNEIKDYPLSVALSQLNQSEMGIAFAASTLYMAPLLLVFLYGENYLVEGLQLSGIKG